MLSADPLVLPEAAVDAVKAYLRLGSADEAALAQSCAQVAAECCEAFTGLALLARLHRETLASEAGGWMRLTPAPMRAITAVEAIAADGSGQALSSGAYLVDIDVDGQGWVRLASGTAARVRVTCQAGIAGNWEALPETLRHGIVRLAAHLFTERGQASASPPAAVSALWRPWRRIGMGGRHVRAG